ncbi:MAG TPA: HEAT repeat domain-containing protein [Planctomycetota bacterium]
MSVVLAILLAAQDVDEARLKELIGRLGGDFLDEREEARKGLEAAGKAAEKPLIDALTHEDPRVRRSCLLLLVKLASAPALPRAAALFKGDEDAGVVDAAFTLIRALGKAAEEDLIDALSAASAEHRRGAVEAIGEIKSAKAVAKLDDMEEKDPDGDVKEKALGVLLILGAPAEPALIKRLDSPDEGRRTRVYQGLKESKNPEVLAAVGKRFSLETSKECVDLAYDILRGAGSKAEAHFHAALKSPQERAREKAIDGLKGLKTAGEIGAVGELFRDDPSEPVRRAAAEFLKSHGLKAEDVLVASLKSATPAVRLEAIRALGEIRSEKPLGEISRLFREDKDVDAHRAAFDYLRRLGTKAEKDLLFALDDADKANIRVPAIQALGAVKSEAAIDRLVEFMGGIDTDTKDPARDALVRIGPKAIAAVEKAVESGRLRRAAADQVRDLVDREGVEAILASLVTEGGQSGWFEGQFKELEAFGKARAAPVLLRMIKEPGYQWRIAERREKIGEYDRLMRELAVMALGEFRDPAALETLKASLAEQPATGVSGTLKEELFVALHKLGDPAPVNEFLKTSTKEGEAALKADRRGPACEIFFSQALVLNRVGRRAEAAEVYVRILGVLPEDTADPDEIDHVRLSRYNLACLKALDGKKAEAVEWLGKAVRAGFKDREWIQRDKDLDAIRGEAGYKALLADDALFDKGDR